MSKRIMTADEAEHMTVSDLVVLATDNRAVAQALAVAAEWAKDARRFAAHLTTREKIEDWFRTASQRSKCAAGPEQVHDIQESCQRSLAEAVSLVCEVAGIAPGSEAYYQRLPYLAVAEYVNEALNGKITPVLVDA